MRRWAAALLVTLSATAGPVTAAEVVEVNLEVASHLPLGPGPFADVAVVGTTAVLSSEACPPTVSLIDAKDPKRPRAASTITLPGDAAATDVDATRIDTPAFTGDLLTIGLAPSPCGTTGAFVGGTLHYDVTDPSAPRLLGRAAPCVDCGSGSDAVSVVQRGDGRTLALRLDGRDAVSVADVSDPGRPVPLGRWDVPRAPPLPCVDGGRLTGAQLYDDGHRILVVRSDGRVFDLDVTESGTPLGEGTAVRPGRSTFGAVLPVARRTLAVVAEERGDDACPGETGLRLLEVGRGGPPVELDPVRFTTPAAPGRLVASGELAYVAWHGDGLRVVDVGQVKPKTVAQFRPAAADVVGVALLPEHVVVSDRTSGLYILRRPDEGGAESSFWSQLAGLLPYLLFAFLAAALFAVPRLGLWRVPACGRMPGPVPSGERRRRHA